MPGPPATESELLSFCIGIACPYRDDWALDGSMQLALMICWAKAAHFAIRLPIAVERQVL